MKIGNAVTRSCLRCGSSENILIDKRRTANGDLFELRHYCEQGQPDEIQAQTTCWGRTVEEVVQLWNRRASD